MERLISRRWLEYRSAQALPSTPGAYPFGVGRRVTGQAVHAFFVEPDQLDQVFDCEVRERLDAVFAEASDSDDPVLGLHFNRDVAQPHLDPGVMA